MITGFAFLFSIASKKWKWVVYLSLSMRNEKFTFHFSFQVKMILFLGKNVSYTLCTGLAQICGLATGLKWNMNTHFPYIHWQ